MLSVAGRRGCRALVFSLVFEKTVERRLSKGYGGQQ